MKPRAVLCAELTARNNNVMKLARAAKYSLCGSRRRRHIIEIAKISSLAGYGDNNGSAHNDRPPDQPRILRHGSAAEAGARGRFARRRQAEPEGARAGGGQPACDKMAVWLFLKNH